MDIRVKICSAQHNENVAGIVQDALVALPFLTRKSYRATLDIFYDCIMTLSYQTRQRLYPDLDPEPIQLPSTIDVEDLFKRAAMYYPDEFDDNFRPVKKSLPGRVLASALFPKDFYYHRRTYDDDEVFGEQDPVVLIENGILRSGDLVKKVIGAKSNSIVHVLAIEYGSHVASEFLSNAQFLCHRWFPTHGFSFGIGDCLNSKDDEIEKTLRDMYERTDQILASEKSAVDKEREMGDELNSAVSIGQSLTKNGMIGGIDNSMVVCTYTGAKGNYVNCTQISAYVGQQNIMGERVPNTLNHKTRTLPHFSPGDNSPEARGFIDRNLKTGILPTHYYYHAAASREGLMDTAIKTQKSGYIQRCLVKKMENFCIYTDGTVRDCDDSIVAFVYGEFGFDPRKLYYVNGNTNFVDIQRLADRLNSVYRHHSPNQLPKMVTLQEKHISVILEQIRPLGSANQSEVMQNVSKRIHAQLRDQISNVKLYANREIIGKFTAEIIKRFYTSCIEAGDMVGIIAASSLGEKSTQMTLNTFHSAGLTTKTVTTGVPRLKEIIDVTQNPKTPSTLIRLKDEFISQCEDELNQIENGDDRMYDIKKQIVERMQIHRSTFESSTLESIVSSHQLLYVRQTDGSVPANTPIGLYKYKEFVNEWWVDTYTTLNNLETIQASKWVIEFTVNQKRLFELRLSMDSVCKKLSESDCDENFVCIPSPQSIGRILVFVMYDNLDAKLLDALINTGSLINENNWYYYYTRDVLTPQLLKTCICGIAGVERIFPVEVIENDEKKWFIDVQGKNYSEITQLDIVDFVDTLSDDMWEIYKMLDIDAVRIFLIEEVRKVLCSEGGYININHFMLLADSITRSGDIGGARRHDIDRSVGPITKASFEEAMTNFLKAAIYTENDDMKSVSSTIAFGKLCKIGTQSGYFDLISTT